MRHGEEDTDLSAFEEPTSVRELFSAVRRSLSFRFLCTAKRPSTATSGSGLVLYRRVSSSSSSLALSLAFSRKCGAGDVEPRTCIEHPCACTAGNLTCGGREFSNERLSREDVWVSVSRSPSRLLPRRSPNSTDTSEDMLRHLRQVPALER